MNITVIRIKIQIIKKYKIFFYSMIDVSYSFISFLFLLLNSYVNENIIWK